MHALRDRRSEMGERLIKHIRSLGMFCMLSLCNAGVGFAISLPDQPLLLPGAGVLPNGTVTLDNSNVSIKGSSDGGGIEAAARRYHFSAAYNTLYYDPTKRYDPPPGYAHQSFDAACSYFDVGCDVNLSAGYRGTGEYSPSGGSRSMWHPRCDSTQKTDDKGRPIGECNAQDECTGASCKFVNRDNKHHAYYYWRDTGRTNCTADDLKDEDCYRYIRVGSVEDQALGGYTEAEAKGNFANWYSYYRTAQMTYISAMLRAFHKLEGKVRLAWQAHGQPTVHEQTCAGFGQEISGDPDWHRGCSINKGGTTTTYDNRLALFASGHKNDFYKWLVDIPYAPRPPNTARAAMIRAAEYFMRDNAYRDDPRDSASPMRSCRPNYHVMFNGPGWSNRDNESSGRDVASRVSSYPCSGRHLDTCTRLSRPASALLASPNGWLPRAPYQMNPGDDSTTKGWDERGGLDKTTASYTLGSLALYYWATDLHRLDNNVPPYLTDRSGDFNDQFWNPRNEPATWQHMVNFMVVNTSPAALQSDWVGDMYSGPIVQGAKGWPYVSTTSGQTPRAYIYDFWRAALNSRGLFRPADDVDQMVNALTQTFDELLSRATSSTVLTSNISSTETIAGTEIYKASFYANDWSGDLAAYTLDANGNPAETPAWNASIPASGRRIVFWNGASAAAFAYGALSPTQKAAFDAAAGALDKVDVANWIIGDRSREGVSLRRRTRLLGDIVNSDPVYVGDESYPILTRLSGSEGASYRPFVGSKRDRPKMIYVGANDGMVHGFIAGAGAGGNLCGASGLGQEVFAYIPGAVVGELPHLAKRNYAHRFYVDGPLYAGDAYLNLGDGDKWRTILLGGLGSGGRAVFALDVTDPCAFDAGKVLWEFSSAQDADLGYTHARPLTAKLNNGQWAAIVANGYNSVNGHAVLFLLDLKTGAIIKKIDADAGAGSLDNGLMTPTLYDANGDGIVDYIYAGDNLGRLWKFDLSGTNPAEWKVAYGGQPLFRTDGEPIQAAPRLGDPPPGVDGVMVYLGSGRLVTDGDKTDSAGRALYGVLDNGTGNLNRANLQPQSVTSEETTAGRTIRKATRNAVDYTTRRGWYLPLSAGERVITPAQFVFGRILFTSVKPSDDPCGPGGESWVYELDPVTGAMPASSIFELTDEPVELAALKLKGLSKSAIFLRDYGVGKGVMLSQDITGSIGPGVGISVPRRLGRVSWRELTD